MPSAPLTSIAPHRTSDPSYTAQVIPFFVDEHGPLPHNTHQDLLFRLDSHQERGIATPEFSVSVVLCPPEEEQCKIERLSKQCLVDAATLRLLEAP